jgi:hypothetical protein
VRTARTLHDLAALGLDANDAPVKKGVLWLLERPQSPESPGMFFLDDGLAARQVEVVAERRRFDAEGRRGSRPRFRGRRTSEIARARAGDDTAHDPCGPRLMWPNAFALEALLRLGYEEHPRVQATLGTLRHAGWCECAYQHGVADWGEPPTLEEIAAREARFRAQFRYGGLEGTEDLDKRDLTQTVGDKMPRVAHEVEDGADLYPLRMPTHQQPCELITVKALRYVLDPALRRLAEAYLWRFAARQHAPDGHVAGEGYKHVGPYFYLNLFSGYDTPVARVALLRALPWIRAEQNPDGAWGADGHQDAATLAVVRALVALGAPL